MFYFFVSVHGQNRAVAMLSVYGAPSQSLLDASEATLLSCRHGGDQGVRVVDVKDIKSVVAMIPHKVMVPGSDVMQDRFYLGEKPGLDVALFVEEVDRDEQIPE